MLSTRIESFIELGHQIKAAIDRKDGEYEGMMKIISETENVKVTNTIYQDIVDEAYVKEYELKADPEFARTINGFNFRCVEKSSRINEKINDEKAVIKT